MVKYNLASRSVEVAYLGFYIQDEKLYFNFNGITHSNSVFNELDSESIRYAVDFLDNLIQEIKDKFKNLGDDFTLTKNEDNPFIVEVLSDVVINSGCDEDDYNKFILIKDVVNHINNSCELAIKDYYQNKRWFGKIDKCLDIK